MASIDSETPKTASGLPAGIWQVDPAASELAFEARGMFSLAKVRGIFEQFEGELHVHEDSTHGELRITAASLNTKNDKRDKHLRSPDFFDAEHHGTVVFSLTDVQQASGGLTLTGDLKVRENSLTITSPLDASAPSADTLQLSTSLSVDREAAGLGWSKLGMIKGPAHLHATVALKRQA